MGSDIGVCHVHVHGTLPVVVGNMDGESLVCAEDDVIDTDYWAWYSL